MLEGVSEGCLYLETSMSCDCLYDSLVVLLQIRRAILLSVFHLYATVGKSVGRASLNCSVHAELAILVQRLMFAIFIDGMLSDRNTFCLLILGNWLIGLLPFTSCLYKAIEVSYGGKKIFFFLFETFHF